MQQPWPLYKRHRFPGEIISHAVWLYYRFLLSYRWQRGLCDSPGATAEALATRRAAVVLHRPV